MKNKLLIAFLSLFICLFSNAQTPTFLHSQSFQASGVGGAPVMNINVPSGQNRLMVIHMFIERNHSPVNSNWPFAPDGSGGLQADGGNFFPYIGGIQTLYRANRTLRAPVSITAYSTNQLVFYLRDVDGLPTGPTTITLPGLNAAERASDEIAVNVMVFSNVKDLSPELGYGSSGETGTTITELSTTGTRTAIPTGRTFSDMIYVGLGGSSQQSAVSIPGWTSPTGTSVVVNNTAGPDFYNTGTNEPDGIAIIAGYRTYTNSTTDPSFNLTRNNSVSIRRLYSYIYGLIPFAKPAVTGTVYRDNNGFPIDGGGDGGVWNQANTLWVNAIDVNNNVVATALVNNSGVFNFPEGSNLNEGETIRFQLSRNQGVIGQPAPAKELPTGWATVGESTNSGPSDGTPNGEFTLVIGTTSSADNITNRFGVVSCVAGAAAPTFVTNAQLTLASGRYSYNIPCASTTANLNTVTTTNKPSPSSVIITWHSGTPATNANRINPATAVAGTVKVYGAFYDTNLQCYSPTRELTIYAPICATVDDYTATPVVYGTTTTLPISIFNNDTYGGSPLVMPNANIQFNDEMWFNEVVVNPNGTLTVTPSSSFGVGTHTLYYSICDINPNGIAGSSCANAKVIIRVIACNAGTAAPAVQNINNNCPATTADLSTAHVGTTPTNATLVWFTNNTHSGSALSSTQITSAGAGTYYAFYYDSVNNCYSNASNAVTVTINGCQTCPISTVNLLAYNGLSTSESVFTNNYIAIGKNRLSLTNTTNLPASLFTTNRISDNHFDSEYGINIGHNQSTGLPDAQKIVTTLSFQNPINYLKFTLSDIDYGDNVTVNAYDENNVLINMTASNYFIHFPANVAVSGNRFYDAQYPVVFQAPNNTRQGTVDVNFSGKKVSKVVFEFTDQAQTGAYSIAKIAGENCDTCTQPGSTEMGGLPTKIGITVQQKQAAWPENIPNGHIALESKEKGFVITRVGHVSFTPQNTDSIADPVSGMLVYDIQDACVKLFNGENWNCITQSCNTTTTN